MQDFKCIFAASVVSFSIQKDGGWWLLSDPERRMLLVSQNLALRRLSKLFLSFVVQIQKQVSFVDDVYKLHNLPIFYKVCLMVYWVLYLSTLVLFLQGITCAKKTILCVTCNKTFDSFGSCLRTRFSGTSKVVAISKIVSQCQE